MENPLSGLQKLSMDGADVALTWQRPIDVVVQICRDIELGQILDLVVAIAKITSTAGYRQPILDAALAGLRKPAD